MHFILDIKCAKRKKRGIQVQREQIINILNIDKTFRILQLPDRSSRLGAGLPSAAAGPGLGSAAGLPAALGAAAGARPGARAPGLGPGPGAGTAGPGPGPRPREAVKKCITTATSYQSNN
jgi:hypothetical protein